MWLFDHGWHTLEGFLDEHRGPVLFLGTLFVIGVIFGALAVRSLEPKDKQELVAYLAGSVTSLENPPAGAPALLLRRALLGNAKLLALLWVLGISVVGVLGVMLLTVLRGFMTGFVVAFLAAEMGWPGVLLAVAGHVPQSLLEVPVLILAGTASVAFSARVFRSWREGRRVPNFYPALASYTAALCVMGLVLILAGFVEAYLSPALVHLSAAALKSP